MKAKVLIYGGSILLLAIAVLGFTAMVNNVNSDQLYAERYCEAYGLELDYYNTVVPTVVCVGEDTQLTVVWE